MCILRLSKRRSVLLSRSGSDVVSVTSQILVAEVENLTHDAFEQTDEIKALCNEIVQTIREIMMTSPVYK